MLMTNKGLTEPGVAKVIRDAGVFEQHARRIIEQRLAEQAFAKVSKEIANQEKAADLPGDLRQRIEAMLNEQSELPWDVTVARIVRSSEV